jgi:hypothetical protein
MKSKTENRRLYGDAKLIEELLGSMQLVEESEGGFAAVYKDPVTRAFWLKYYATSGSKGGGYLTLAKLPTPVTADLINIAITSEFEDEAVAAMLRLLDEETIEKKDFRLQLIEQVEQVDLQDQNKKQRILEIIKITGLDDPTNRRKLLHKSATEIQADADYFKTVATRANNLLQKLKL